MATTMDMEDPPCVVRDSDGSSMDGTEMAMAPCIELDGGDKAERSIVFQMLTSDDDSDAETTVGSSVASPTPVPPVAQASDWMERRSREVQTGRPKRIEDVFGPTSTRIHDDLNSDDEEDDFFEPNEPVQVSQQNDIMLSPASQLHVLSQISAMAESRAAKERTATASNATARVVRKAHAWAPAAQHAQPPQSKTAKRKLSAKATAGTSTIREKPRKMARISAGIAAEMQEWDSFDEPILLGDDDEPAEWSFDELSDSDF